MALRHNRRNITPAKARLLHDRARAWAKCRVLAVGIGRALRVCYDVDDLLYILELMPGLTHAAQVAKDAEDKCMAPPSKRVVRVAKARHRSS